MTADWYLMRATGVVSLVLLTIVLALGIATKKRSRIGSAPVSATAAVHRSLSLMAVVFLAVHVVTAVIDPFAAVHVTSIVIPFVGSGNPLWVGLGTVSIDLAAALIVSSLLRQRIGVKLWRAIHWLAYLAWPTAFAHTLGVGSDVRHAWLQIVAVACAGAIALAVALRVVKPRSSKRIARSRSRVSRESTGARLRPQVEIRSR